MNKRNFLIIVFHSCFLSLYSQTWNDNNNGVDTAKFEYELIPSIGDIQLTSVMGSVNIYKKVKRTMIGLGLDYENHAFYFKGINESSRFEVFSNLHNLSLDFFIKQSLNNEWSFNLSLMPTLASNLEGGITKEDFILNSYASFSKKWNRQGLNSSLDIGLGYGTLFGNPRLFPLLSYHKELNDKISFTIGLPVTGLYYKINEGNSIDITAKPEGFYTNNSNGFYFDESNTYDSTKIEYSALKLGLGYQLKFDNNWSTYFNVGYIPTSSIEVLDNNNDTLYDFNTNESLFINVKLSLNISNTKK